MDSPRTTGAPLTAGPSPVFRHRPAPMFGGATAWLNSQPLERQALRGHVVLVDFWTFTCINWIRTAPYRRAWSHAYRDEGVTVVGVHTPEFSFEHDVDSVRLAIRQRGLDYPVAVDNDYTIWDAFDNSYWPALYIVDKEGSIRHAHFGEGGYAASERVLQRLLGVDRELVSVEGRGVEAEADWGHLRTPETYLGSGRGGALAVSRDGFYEIPQRLTLNRWALSGEWGIGREQVVLKQAGGSIAFRFHARDVHLVLSHQPGIRIPYQVSLDGKPPAASHGVDVDRSGEGLLDGGRLYHLIRTHDTVRERTLRIAFSEPGAEAYVFTFG